jgi:uncharacterized membrane protein
MLRRARTFGLAGATIFLASLPFLFFSLFFNPYLLLFCVPVDIFASILILLGVKLLDKNAFFTMLLATIFSIIANTLSVPIIFSLEEIKNYSAITAIHSFSTTAFLLTAGVLFSILWASFLMITYLRLGRMFRNDYFKASGVLYFLSAVLSLILVGVFLLPVASITEVLAWLTLKRKRKK